MRSYRKLIAIMFVAPLLGERLPIQPYTTSEGLAHNRVKRIRSDSRGFLWFCTDEGLSRFDGHSFKNYTVRDGLPHPWVNDLLETRDGAYWVATDGGVCRYYPTGKQRFRVYVPSARPGANRINYLLEDRDGDIWCATYVGLYRMLRTGGDEVRFIREEIGAPAHFEGSVVNSVFLDRRNTLWAAGQSGLYRREKSGSWERHLSPGRKPDDPFGNFFETISEDRDGRLWAATRAGWGLCSVSPETKPGGHAVSQCYSTADGLPSNDVRAIYQSSDKRLWIGTVGGLSEFQSSTGSTRFRNYTIANGLSESAIYSLQEDRDGNLWIGTKENGIMKMARGGLTTYGETEGYRSGGFASSIFESRSGELYVTAGERGAPDLNVFDGTRFSAIRVNAPVGADALWETAMLQGRDGEWWVTTGVGLFGFRPVRRAQELSQLRPETAFIVTQGLLDNSVHPLYQDSKGDLWFATSRSGTHQLYRWDRTTRRLGKVSTAGAPSVKHKVVTAIAEDRSGEIWIGFTEGGLARGRANAFADFAHQPMGSVQALHFDGAGRLWIASLESGVTRVEDLTSDRPRIRSFTTNDGLSSNNVWCLTEDGFGRIYFGTGRGVDRLDPATGSIRHYTTSEGLAKGAVKAAYRDRSGALWFATNSGISRLIPARDLDSSPPVILITALRVMGTPYPISELGERHIAGITLQPSQNRVEVEFVGLNFSLTSRPRYQYKLDSADHDWSPPSAERTINFASLAPGSYRFLVQTVNTDGVSSPQPATLEFTVMKPIWARWWFLAAMSLTAGTMAYGAYRYRVAQLMRLQLVRARIAADLHDDIGASLSQIAVLSEVARARLDESRLDAAGPLAEITTISREVMDSIGDMVWVINPKYDHLSDLVARIRRFAGDILGGRNIDLQFRVPDADQDPLLGTEVRRHLLLIAKEAVNNIARHSGASQAGMEFELHAQRLNLLVSDNGRGFDCIESQQGNGLANIRRRAEWLRGTVEFQSSPGKGVLIKVTAPL